MLFRVRVLGLVFVAALAGVWPMAAQASGGLGSAAGFSVLASTAVTCTDANVTGLVGVSSSGTAITSTRCNMQTQVAPGAYADFESVYGGIAGSLGPCTQTFGIADTLAGVSLGPGIYCFPAAATLTGTLTLTGSGPWLFEVGTLGTGALTATNFNVVGSNPCNATWWVRQAATTTTSALQGAILAGADITLTGTSLAGRAFATGAVTMTGSDLFGCSSAGTVALPFAPGGGSFVIGDQSSAIGSSVEFWGAQWARMNSLSGGPAPRSFKGFAESPQTPACGTNWTADPGNSTPPPKGPLPAVMAVIVTSVATKSGNTISGDTLHIVIVKTDTGYAPNPGHAGTGTVLLMVC
jgi:hypothetical protein